MPRLARPRVTLAALAVAALATAGPTSAALDGCPMFPADNIWSARVDTLPIHPRSAEYVASIGPSIGLHPDFGAGTWDGGPIGIPYATVPGSQPPVGITFHYDTESDPGPYPIPPDAPIEGGPASGGDRHVLLVDRDRCTLYEVYDAHPRDDGTWEAGSGAVWDLRSHGLRPATWTSADAAGLPILPGLVRYDEVAAGEIRHALRFTAQRTQRAYVWPARHHASSITDPGVPPMGQRFRLRASFDVSPFAPEVRIILQALKTYGMMLADNGSNWFVSGAPDPRWDDDVLVAALRQVKGADFEAVDVSGLMVHPDSGQAGAGTPDAPPTLTVGASQAIYRAGETLRVSLAAQNPGPAVAIDFALGVRLPDGQTVVFLSSLSPLSGVATTLSADARTFPLLARGAVLPAGFATSLDSVFAYAFTGAEPPGQYQLLAILIRAGAFTDGAIDPGDVLVMATHAFQLAP